jgi:hypothetical protein
LSGERRAAIPLFGGRVFHGAADGGIRPPQSGPDGSRRRDSISIRKAFLRNDLPHTFTREIDGSCAAATRNRPAAAVGRRRIDQETGSFLEILPTPN